MVATIRALGPKVTDWASILQSLHWLMISVGNVPLDWPAPNGYPDVATAWRSAGNLLTLWNLHLGLAGSWWGGLKAPATADLYDAKPKTSGEAIDALTTRLTGMRFGTAHRAALQGFLNEPASTPLDQSNLRWVGYPLTAIILDGPHHALR